MERDNKEKDVTDRRKFIWMAQIMYDCVGQWGALKCDWNSTAAACVYPTSLKFVCFKTLKSIMATVESNYKSVFLVNGQSVNVEPLLRAGSLGEPLKRLIINEINCEARKEEIEDFATKQICPRHFRLRIGGLLITLLSLRIIRTELAQFLKQLLHLIFYTLVYAILTLFLGCHFT